MYIDKLDDIVNEYNNPYRTIKMKPTEVKDNTYIDSIKDVNDKDSKFKVVDHVRISNTKTFLLKDILQIGLEKFLWLKKLKILFHGHVINDLSGEEIIGTFYEKKNTKNKSTRI